ncbi:MAG: DUF4159 domain-containing protein [Ignavibacteriales bacterium]|nr:DUF4159 domain-containing protein [Ignavibacteriales bacterium]
MKKMFFKIFLVSILCSSVICFSQSKEGFQIVRLKYNGGGDWYNDPSAEVNLLNFVQANTNISVKPEYKFVDLSSEEIFAYPFLFLTGHGNVVFSSDEVERLKKYLDSGGFLYIDDDYGMDKAIRREIKKVFPENELVEIPFNYGLYHCLFDFQNGPPKTHEHDNKPPQGFGIFLGSRLAVYYTYESNPSDGWADQIVHNDPQEKREEALRFGANIIVWALSNGVKIN